MGRYSDKHSLVPLLLPGSYRRWGTVTGSLSRASIVDLMRLVCLFFSVPMLHAVGLCEPAFVSNREVYFLRLAQAQIRPHVHLVVIGEAVIDSQPDHEVVSDSPRRHRLTRERIPSALGPVSFASFTTCSFVTIAPPDCFRPRVKPPRS